MFCPISSEETNFHFLFGARPVAFYKKFKISKDLFTLQIDY